MSTEALNVDDLAEESTTQHLLFTLGAETFAVHVAHVKEIIEYPGVTEVPMTPPHVRGVINLRGRVVPVVDLSVRFGRAQTVPGKRTSVVITELGAAGEGEPAHLVGVLVNSVSEVVELPPSAIAAPPGFGASIRDRFISGIARHRERFVVVLDLSTVLSLSELALVDEATHDGPTA
jgi:purine-binding chemotaxis protein CheW